MCWGVVLHTSIITGKGLLAETIHFETLNVLPLMHIEKALYGHPTNIAKVTTLILLCLLVINQNYSVYFVSFSSNSNLILHPRSKIW